MISTSGQFQEFSPQFPRSVRVVEVEVVQQDRNPLHGRGGQRTSDVDSPRSGRFLHGSAS